MPLTEANVEQIGQRVIALGQRVEQVREAATHLNRPNYWRSPDGTLAVGSLTAEEKARLEAYINVVLDEAEAIIATVRGMMRERPADAV